MYKLNYKLFLFFSFFVLCTLYSTLHPAGVLAQVPNPPIACDKVGNPEFNSLRPYQASATCNTQIANYASYCGNDLTFKDTIEVQYPGSSEYQTGCSESGGQVYCDYVVPVTIQKLVINLSEADLPIMGNTEDVKNSQSSDDILTPADKMSNYVSWYLNGVLNRAEYLPLDMNTDIFKIVNYSGPINKLVPQEVQQQQRAETVKNAKDTRHDQVVACIYKVLGGIPAPCYESGLLKSLTTQLRLSDWKDHLPPVRADYQDNIDYQNALQSWRGKSCIEIKIPDFIPVLGGKGIILCYDDPGKPNYYATLYSYIPLSSTEDLKGGIKIDSVSSASGSENGGVTLTGVTFSNQKPADLFFSHMAEDNQLGSLLQDTYTSKGLDKTGDPTNIAAETACESIEVRSNPGDDLFANEITGTLKYTANFTCQYDPITTWIDQQCLERCLVRALDPEICPIQCKRTTPTQTCTKDVYIKLSTKSSTPEVDSIWSRLVAGPMSIFKRIFPKTNVEGSVGQIMDIAGSTNITYTGTNITQNSTDLKLPHLGGISEYFLKGIQTALRPKGFGESIEFANVPDSPGTGETVNCDPNCNKNPTGVDMNGVKENFIANGVRWGYGTAGAPRIDLYDTVVSKAKAAGVDPIFILALWIHESGASNYSAICSVQGHSNPNSPFCQAVQDFGINDLSIETKFDSHGNIIEDHFMDQLNAVVNLPGYYYDLCNGKAEITCPIEYFFSMFRLGQCKSNAETIALTASVKRIYNILTSQTFVCYPMKLPSN